MKTYRRALRILFTAAVGMAVLSVAPLGAMAQQTLYVIDNNTTSVEKISPGGVRSTITSALGSCDALAVDAAGNLYVGYASSSGYGGGVHWIAPDGTIQDFNTYPSIANVTGLAFDSAGHLFDSEYGTDANNHSVVHKITQGGVASSFALLTGPQRQVAFDAAGNLYVAGVNTGSVTKISPNGTESTFASGLNSPWGLAFDASGNLYVSIYGNGSGSTVVKITPQGVQSTFATALSGPSGIAFDQDGNLYVANYSSTTITRITPAGIESTFASGLSNPDALAFSAPTIPAITTTPSATASVGTAYSYRIAAANGATSYSAVGLPPGLSLNASTGIISGTPTKGGAYTISLFAANAHGTGSGILTLAVSPGASLQTLYVSENSNTVVKVAPNGTQTQFVTGVGGIAPITVDGAGNVYAGTDVGSGYGGYVLRFTPDGAQSYVASYPSIQNPIGLALDANGNLFEAEAEVISNNDSTIHKITPGGTVTAFATVPGQQGGDAFDSHGNLFATSITGNSVSRITPDGTVSSFATGLDEPRGLAIDANDNVYVANGGNGFGLTVSKITPAGVVSTYATGLQAPDGLAVDHYGNLYVANSATHGTGTITEITPAGAKGTFAAGFTNPTGLAFSAAHAPFFAGEVPLANGVYYLSFANGDYFGYYSYLANANYIYHFDLGYEYVFDANDGHSGVYFYDFKSNGFFYTSPTFPFPYLYDFSLNSVVYYYGDPNHADRYNTDGVRYFYVFSTGKIISK